MRLLLQSPQAAVMWPHCTRADSGAIEARNFMSVWEYQESAFSSLQRPKGCMHESLREGLR